MSKATKLNESVVTSLTDTDLVIAADNGGTLHPISVTNLMQLIRDNIKIGGRNLLKGANKDITSTNQILIGRYFFGNTIPVKGETYTLSICYSLQGESIRGSMYGGNLHDPFAFYTNGSRIVASKTVYMRPEVPESANAAIGFEFYRAKPNDRYPATIHWAVLTKGNLGVVDWSPAPEDLSGGVMHRLSIAYDYTPSKRQKGAPHEQSDKHQRRSYTILTQGGHIQRIAERDNDRCSRGKRVRYEGRQRQRDNHPRGLHRGIRQPNTRSSLRDIHVWQSDGGKRWALYLPDIPHGQRRSLSAQKVCRGALEYLVPFRVRHSGFIAPCGKEVVAI